MRFCLALLLAGFASTAQTRPDQSPEALASERAQQDLLWHKMSGAIAKIDGGFDGVMGVAIRDLTGGREYLLNAGEIFPTASSIKALILATLFHESAAGRINLDAGYTPRKEDLVDESVVLEMLTPGVSKVTNRDLARFMIVESDNGATNVLIDRLGMERINEMSAALGLQQTRLRRRMIDRAAALAGRENTSTPREMAALFEAIYRGKAGTEQSTAEMLQILSTPKTAFLRRGIPAGTRIADKPGELEGVRTDTAIIHAPQRPFVISVMTTYAKDEAAAERAIAQVAAAAYDFFHAAGASSVYGRQIRAIE
jgi:beta-lactamase class A